jgi:hypothetical protein
VLVARRSYANYGIIFVPNSVAPTPFYVPVRFYLKEFRIHHVVVELAKGKIKKEKCYPSRRLEYWSTTVAVETS